MPYSPYTGQWVDDNGDLAATGLVGQQDSASSPPLVPPFNPDALLPPTPDYVPAPQPQTQPGVGAQPVPEVQAPGAPLGSLGSIEQPPPPFEGNTPLSPEEQAQLAALGLGNAGATVDGAPPPVAMPDLPPGGVQVGEPTMIAPDAGAAPGVDLPPEVADAATPPPPDLKLPEPDLKLPDKGQPALDGGAPMLSPPDLQLAEPGVGSVPTDATAGAVPPPSAPQADAGAPLDERQARQQTTAEKIDLSREQTKLDIQDAAEKARLAKEVSDLKVGYQKQGQAIVDRMEDDLSRARSLQQADYQKYRAMGEKDAWGDNPTATKVLAGLVAILGGRNGAALVLGAAQGLEEKKKEQIETQAKLLERDGKNVEQIQEFKSKALADLKVQQGAALEATAARAEAELESRGVPRAQIAGNLEITKIKEASAAAQLKADELAHKEAEQKGKDDLAALKTQSEIDLNKARIGHLGRGKGGGGGGGGRGGTAGLTEEELASGMSPAEALSARIEKGNVDPETGVRRELSQAEKIHAANQLHIPVTGKPSETTLKSINAGVAFDENQGIKKGAQGIKEDNQTRQDTRLWSQQNNVPKAIAARDKILDVKDKLSDPDASPVTIASAIMEFDTAARQGTATQASFEALSGHLAPGLFNKIQAMYAHKTGMFTATEISELKKGVTAAVKASDEEGNRLHDSYKSKFYNDPKYLDKKGSVAAESESMFGRWGYKSDQSKKQEERTGGGSSAPAPKFVPIKTKQDKVLLIKARATRAAGPGNPDYQDAVQWLGMHGQ